MVLNLCSEKLSEWDVGGCLLQLIEKGFSFRKWLENLNPLQDLLFLRLSSEFNCIMPCAF